MGYLPAGCCHGGGGEISTSGTEWVEVRHLSPLLADSGYSRGASGLTTIRMPDCPGSGLRTCPCREKGLCPGLGASSSWGGICLKLWLDLRLPMMWKGGGRGLEWRVCLCLLNNNLWLEHQGSSAQMRVICFPHMVISLPSALPCLPIHSPAPMSLGKVVPSRPLPFSLSLPAAPCLFP